MLEFALARVGEAARRTTMATVQTVSSLPCSDGYCNGHAHRISGVPTTTIMIDSGRPSRQ